MQEEKPSQKIGPEPVADICPKEAQIALMAEALVAFHDWHMDQDPRGYMDSYLYDTFIDAVGPQVGDPIN